MGLSWADRLGWTVQLMDTFLRLGAPTPISLNDGLSFNSNDNRNQENIG